MDIKYNAVNQAEKGTIIYAENKQIDSICIILKGRVLAVNNGSKMCFGSGSFLGISDLYVGHFMQSYIAYDDLTFYCFPILRKEGLEDILKINKDYKGLVVVSLIKYISEMEKIYSNLNRYVVQLHGFVQANYKLYIETSTRLGYTMNELNSIQEMIPYESDYEIDEKKLLYYKDCMKIPLEVWKSFCNAGETIVPYLMEDLSGLIAQLLIECNDMSSYIEELFYYLMNNNENCLYKSIATLAISIEEAGGNKDELVHTIDNIIDEINIIEKLFDEMVGSNLKVDRNRMEEIYYLLMSKHSDRNESAKDQFKYTQEETQRVDAELNQSLKQILNYSKIDSEIAAKLERYVLDFMNLKDRYSSDDTARLLRKRIMEIFYDLYEKTFFNAYKDKEIPRVIDMFLKYGYLDERLLSKEQLKELYFLEDKRPEETGPCKIYTNKDWLISVYEGRKEPSKNDFDLDYKDMLREKRKRKEITEVEEKVLQQDLTKKVIYEIHNVFRYNHRLVNGYITSFVPFLCGENMIQSIEKLYVTGERVNEVIKELLSIDYSIFHRELLYVNNEKGIVKEYIMKQVFPDIILMPTVGYNGVMWQEITEKRKSKEGRFILPMFTDASIREMLIKVFGKYRWELCRTIQGGSWNNIKYKSLTSEYADYIQFYRKNRDLSEEMKEKLKMQIQKGKNSYREIFVIDYENWIKSESNGALRLNRIAREMFATYCPFKKSIREKLMGQPLFADAMARFDRNNHRKIRDLDLRYRSLEKENIEITDELKETLFFYREL